MKSFYIIDGSWYMFRAYYGLPEMKNTNWENINLIFGFLKMILRLLLEQPDYFLISWDLPKKTIRHEKFSEYKSNRIKIPDDFKSQIPILQDIIKNIWIPSLWIEWYEADDIIYSFAKIWSSKNIQTTIFSWDKDMKQVLDQNIIFKDPMKNKITKYADFLQEYWFEPKYIVDYLALIWDTSDNIPWVVWIWPKTAIWLISKYNTIENIYLNIDKIAPKIKEKLIFWKESVLYSKDLILLMEISNLDIENCKYDIDFDNIYDIIIDKMWFNSFVGILNELKHKKSMPKEVWLFW